MKQKLMSILLMALLVISMVPAVFAENDTTNTSVGVDVEVEVGVDASSDNEEEETNDNDEDVEEETEEESEEESDESEEESSQETETDDEVEEDEEEVSDEDETEVTEDDEEEVEDFDMSAGAELRFLQLERSILRNLLIGDAVVTRLQENEEDTTELDVILVELESVLETVQDVDYDLEAKELAVIFVENKKASISLTKDFRAAVKGLLSEDDKASIRSDSDLKADLADIDASIKEARQALHASRLEELLENAGIEDDELVEQVANGDISADEVKAKVKAHFAELSPEEKAEARRNVKAKVVKRAEVRSNVRSEVSDRLPDAAKARMEVIAKNKIELRANADNLDELRAERRDRIKSDIKERRSEVKARVELRKDAVLDRLQDRKEAAKDRVDDRRENAQDRIENRKENVQDRIEDQKDRRADIAANAKVRVAVDTRGGEE